MALGPVGPTRIAGRAAVLVLYTARVDSGSAAAPGPATRSLPGRTAYRDGHESESHWHGPGHGVTVAAQAAAAAAEPPEPGAT